jgi:Na+:H+ antiporter, NhaA family
MSSDEGKRSFFDTLQEFSIPLLGGVIVALVWANLDAHGYHAAMHWSPFGEGGHLNLHFIANEIVMVFFFGLATKEITEACLPGGALNPPRKAVNPLMGTLGGVLGPVGVFFLMTFLLDAPEVRRGWGVPTATDIALAWLVARLVFGARHPAVSFLLLLAVADDAIGLGIIAVFYPDPNNPVVLPWLGLVVVAMAIAYGLRRKGVSAFWPYLAVAGAISWVGLFFAHLHPALALVPVVPFMPNRGADEGMFAETGKGYRDTLNRFEHALKGPVDFALFAFGLANAGVPFASVGAATWSVVVALVIGKPLGITVFSMVAHVLGFSLPQGMRLRALVLAGLIAGMGLTVALFVSGVAFVDPTLQGAAKMGALFSSVAAPLALVLGKLVSVNRKESVAPGEPEPVINPSGHISLRGLAQAPPESEMDLGDHDDLDLEPTPSKGGP